MKNLVVNLSIKSIIASSLIFCASASFADSTTQELDAVASQAKQTLKEKKAQQTLSPTANKALSEIADRPSENIRQQGQWYFYWGWNRAKYTDSDIKFKGDDHNFTLHNAAATDRQNKVTLHSVFDRYLNPTAITIPQYNYRFGYFIQDDWSVSIGFDHMKYVVTQGQTLKVTGTIDNAGDGYTAKPNPAAEQRTLQGQFVHFEHTDGLNAITLETEKFYSLWNHNQKHDIALFAGLGGGIMYPKTNAKILGYSRNDEFHVSGYTASVKAGVELTIYHNWFFRGMIKHGYVNMDDILTTNQGGKAEQTFYYDQYIGVFGYRF